MKFLKTYKLFEAGEWPKDVDWQYVKDNPDDENEETGWISYLWKQLEYIQDELKKMNNSKKIKLEIIDIKGFDNYSGPYATVRIQNDIYKIWTTNFVEDSLFVENFPINSSEEDGFIGNYIEIANAISDYYDPLKRDTKKYNL